MRSRAEAPPAVCSGMRRGSSRADCFPSTEALHTLHSERQVWLKPPSPLWAAHRNLDMTASRLRA